MRATPAASAVNLQHVACHKRGDSFSYTFPHFGAKRADEFANPGERNDKNDIDKKTKTRGAKVPSIHNETGIQNCQCPLE
jgi:hypothetical protein